jgi:hypothetical protein
MGEGSMNLIGKSFESAGQKSTKTSWGEVVYYLDGLCYGIAPDGRTVCLGAEVHIKTMLADPTKRADNPLVNEIIELERELMKRGNTNGKQPQLKRPGAFRSRAAREIKHRTARPRQTSARKRLPVYTIK